MSPITFETLLKNILNDLKGIIILGMLIIVNVPNPIIKTKVIKINVINPRVICIEYCASLGKDISATVPYKPDFDRLKEHKSGFYCNASLLAYINLLKNKVSHTQAKF